MSTLDVNLDLTQTTLSYSISNTGTKAIKILDAGYNENTAPTSINIRVARTDGTLLLNQAAKAEGWWRSHYVNSNLSTVPVQYITVGSETIISNEFPLAKLLQGIRVEANGTIPLGCKMQVRAQIFVEDMDSPQSYSSEWVTVACEQLEYIKWI